MKYMEILMFVLCINVSIYLMSSTGMFSVFGNTYEMIAEKEWIEGYNETAHNETLEWANPDILDYMLALGVGLWKGIVTVFQIFFQIILLAPTLNKLGIPLDAALIISSPVYFIYLWGIFQVITGKSGKQME